MEKEGFLGNPSGLNWDSADGQMVPEMNPGFLNLNWEQSMDQSAQYESAISSLVSSPSSNPPAGNDSVVIRELIGRLGSICNYGEVSSPTSRYHSNNTSCYSTPLNSPPKLNLSMMDHQHQHQHQPQHQHQQGNGGLPVSMTPTHLAPFASDPGFAERAARFSCFGGKNYSMPNGQFGLPESGKLSRVSSSQSLKRSGSQMGLSEMQDGVQMDLDMRSKFSGRLSGTSTPSDGEFGNGQEESSASKRMTAGAEAPPRGNVENNARKRKAAPKGKGKETPVSSSATNPPKTAEEDLNAKRNKPADTSGTEKDAAAKTQSEQNGGDADQQQGKENNAKPPEPPKDYIHVRARRGQATDSHSLAERVRREKISERMKFLQDLVPGCNKVTGKAVMLDEIINYVQSLQRQVEFLSMKLATVNPRLEFNMENLLPKDIHQQCGPMPPSVYPMDATSTAYSFAHQPPQGTPLQNAMTNGLETQCSLNPLDSSLRRPPSMQLPTLDGFGDAAAASQLGTFWEDDLQSVVQMGFGQSQESAVSSHKFHGQLPTTHMKIEL